MTKPPGPLPEWAPSLSGKYEERGEGGRRAMCTCNISRAGFQSARTLRVDPLSSLRVDDAGVGVGGVVGVGGGALSTLY